MCEGMSLDGPFLRWQQVLCEEGKILAVFTGFLHHCSDGESYDSFSSPVLSLRSNPRVLNIEWPVSSWQFGDGCRSDPRRGSHEESVRSSTLKRRGGLPVAPGDRGASILNRVVRQRGHRTRISGQPAERIKCRLSSDKVGAAGSNRPRRAASPIFRRDAHANGNRENWERIPYLRSSSTG